jgi:glycosyl hydrolase family 26
MPPGAAPRPPGGGGPRPRRGRSLHPAARWVLVLVVVSGISAVSVTAVRQVHARQANAVLPQPTPAAQATPGHTPPSPAAAGHSGGSSPAHSSRPSGKARPSTRPGGSVTSHHRVLLGAYVQPTNGFTAEQVESSVTRLERALGRKLAIDQEYTHWTHPFPLRYERWDLRGGRTPMLSWAGTNTAKIAGGAYDGMIRTRARQLKSLGGTVLLRWFAEMDGVANKANAVSPASYIRAWRHIHGIFAKAGAKNVRFVWCPNAFNFPTGRSQQFYPGSAYVDYVCADGYNWAPKRPNSAWRSFGQIFSGFYRWAKRTGKPVMIGEFGVMEGKPGAKAAWIRQAEQQVRSQFPAIRAVVYFDSNHDSYDWRVTSSSSALAAFRAFARDDYFRARLAT